MRVAICCFSVSELYGFIAVIFRRFQSLSFHRTFVFYPYSLLQKVDFTKLALRLELLFEFSKE